MTGISLAHFFPNFFVAPLGRGAILELVNCVKLALLPQGGHKKSVRKCARLSARHCIVICFRITVTTSGLRDLHPSLVPLNYEKISLNIIMIVF